MRIKAGVVTAIEEKITLIFVAVVHAKLGQSNYETKGFIFPGLVKKMASKERGLANHFPAILNLLLENRFVKFEMNIILL